MKKLPQPSPSITHSFGFVPMRQNSILSSSSRRSVAQQNLAFTLVELLVVLFIFLTLTAVALPTVKGLLADQKISQTARSIAGYFNAARSRAIADGRFVGVRIERLGGGMDDDFPNGASIRLRQLVGVPAYSGDSADSKVSLSAVSNGIVTLTFESQDNQLLSLHNQSNSPFHDRDLIEFPGGKQFHLIFQNPQSNPLATTAFIDLNAPVDGSVNTAGTVMFPGGHLLTADRRLSYKIHRSPVVSSTAPLDMVRGVAIDLTLSGIGTAGFGFAPVTTASNQPIDILFGPDGRVEFLTTDSIGTVGPPSGVIFLCLGNTDGVREFNASEANMFATEGKSVANIANLESIWIVINPNTGRVVSAPFASTSDATTRATALPFTRSLALLSDTLDAEP